MGNYQQKYKCKCLVCHKDIPYPMIYCEEHRQCVEEDDKIIREAPQELLFSLIAGIFLRAREDYIFNTDGQRSDAEVFLRNEWAQELSLSGFDPDKLIEIMDEEIENGHCCHREFIV